MIKTASAVVALTMTAAVAQAQDKTIAFSPLSLEIPAMQGLSGAIEHFTREDGIGYIALDPHFDPAQQGQQLAQVIETGRVQGAWAIAVRAAALRNTVNTAVDKGVAMVVSGAPSDYGFDGPLPGIAFSQVNYVTYGASIGTELGNCINEKLGGEGRILFFGDTSATASGQQADVAAKEAIATVAPTATIVGENLSSDRLESQQKIAQMLQSMRDANAVYASNDENAMGALAAFKAAGMDTPCIVSGGGAEEVVGEIEKGNIYAASGFDFKGDAFQNYTALKAMMEDPTKVGPLLEIPVLVTK